MVRLPDGSPEIGAAVSKQQAETARIGAKISGKDKQ
jgi:hypothetical protein